MLVITHLGDAGACIRRYGKLLSALFLLYGQKMPSQECESKSLEIRHLTVALTEKKFRKKFLKSAREKTIFSTILAVWLLWLLSISSAFAETRAVVIGIDRYQHVSPILRGAVNDATDISTALKSRGDLVTLLDGQATRKSVLSAVDGLIERSQKGDLAIITFSGHGVKETWGDSRPPRIKKGTQREVFLLYNAVLPNSKGLIDLAEGGDPADRWVDAEVNLKLRQLAAKGARIIFVADACHGGGITRSLLLNDLVAQQTYRVVQGRPYASGQDPLETVFQSLPEPIDTDQELPSLTFLGAVDKFHKVTEIEIPAGSKTMRGALSYAFARIIDGTAPIGQEGSVTRGALFDYLNATIRTNAANLQEPDLRPRANFDQAVLNLASDFQQAATPPAQSLASTVAIKVINGKVDIPTKSSPHPFDLITTESWTIADLIYDVPKAAVMTKRGDLVAAAVDPRELIAIAEREYALRKLLKLTVSRPRDIHLDKGDRRYIANERVNLDARHTAGTPIERTHYTLFNIAGDGRVQFLYPIKERGDAVFLSADRTFDEMKVIPPYGTDMLILVASPRPLTELIDQIRLLDGKAASLAAVQLVEKNVGDGVQIGVQGFYTGEARE